MSHAGHFSSYIPHTYINLRNGPRYLSYRYSKRNTGQALAKCQVVFRVENLASLFAASDVCVANSPTNEGTTSSLLLRNGQVHQFKGYGQRSLVLSLVRVMLIEERHHRRLVADW